MFGTLADGLRYSAPQPDSYHPLPESVRPGNPLQRENPALLELNSSLLRDTTIIDFENRQIAFLKVAEPGIPLWQYRYGELNEYIENRWNYGFASQWYREYATGTRTREEAENKRLSLELKLPQHYYNQAIPTWAQRILGKEPPKLSIHGYEEIEISVKKDSYRIPGDETEGSVVPEFKNNYNLTVSGSVGKMINVQMSTSSEEQFEIKDDLKDIKIEYRGEGDELEDDIIQEVSAGYTRFEIPGTHLSGYSESREGLFGINVKSKFGPLLLTTVASHERGEALSKTIHPSQSGSNVVPVSDVDYAAFKFFFLDSVYREAYIQKHNTEKSQKVSPPRILDDYQVWVSVPGNDETNADLDVNNQYRYVRNAGESETPILFKKLVDGNGYELDQSEGWLRIDTTVSANEMVGIYFQTEDAELVPTKGDTAIVDSTAERDTMDALFIIKPKETEFDSAHPVFPLMWRNAYNIGTFTGDVEVVVKRIDEGGGDSIPNGANGYYSDILGLTQDQKRIEDEDIYMLNAGYLIIPPFTDDFQGNEPFRNPELGEDYVRTDMYEVAHNSTKYRNDIRTRPRFAIEVSGASTDRRTRFNLGFGVIEGSEEIRTSGGTRLVRGVDYRLFYDAGELELLSQTAQNAPRLEVKYQRESLFIPESKTFLGARGEIRLPLISENSYIGTSVLYQQSGSSEDIPRIGQEPFNKLLLDVNTSLDFEPEWMTTLVNALPMVETDARSSLQFDVEAAHSRTISTTAGKAYVDDFESSEQLYPISSSHNMWHQSSPPGEVLDSMLVRPPVWDQWWFTPVEGDDDRQRWYRRDSIMVLSQEEKEVSSTDRSFHEQVMLWECIPAGLALYDNYKDPWAGIMQWFPPTSADRTEDRYLEFIVNAKHATGKLHIDLGEISEDISIDGGPPNGVLDKENPKNLAVITDSLNTGLDGVFDSLEYYVVPNATQTGWDTLGLGSDSLPFPSDPSGDNFQEYEYKNDRLDNYRVANGTQEDNSGKIQLLTSEDLNNDRFSKKEAFFRFEIDLDNIEESDFYDSTSATREENGWYKIRIPLKETENNNINGASWERIQYMRMWWDDFGEQKERKHTLAFARMQFVGNQWDPTPIAPASAQHTVMDISGSRVFIQPEPREGVKVSVVNTEEDLAYKAAVTGKSFIPRERDARGIYKKEQALKITYQNIAANEQALARRRYDYQALDISAYDRMGLVVHSDTDQRADSVYFVVRFGNDDSSFYEYRVPLDDGWSATDWAAPIEIDLLELATFKLGLLEYFGPVDTLIDTLWEANSRGASYRIRTRLHRAPSYSNIKDIYLGIVRTGSESALPVSGELWVNEFRVDGLEGFAGSAALASVHMQWADFMSFDGRVEYNDGNFRQMTQHSITPGDSRLQGSAATSVALDKFAPSEWGLSVPVDLSVSRRVERPQLRPGSDIPLQGEDDEPDKLMDFLRSDKKDTTDATHYQKKTTDVSVSTQFRKNRDSKSWLGKFTADRIGLDNISYQTRVYQEHQGRKRTEPGDYMKVDSVITYTGNLAYDLSPRTPPDWTEWRPFEKTTYSWFPNHLKRYELSLLPRTLNFDIARTRYEQNFSRNERVSDTTNLLQRFRLDHGMNLSYSPINPLLDFNYNITASRDLDEESKGRGNWNEWGEFVQDRVIHMDPTWRNYGYLYGEKTRSQTARLQFKPKVFGWLEHTFDYSGRFTSGELSKDGVSSLNLEVQSEFEFRGSVQFGTMFQRMSEGTKTVETLSSVFEAIDKALDKIDLHRVNFNYDAVLTTEYGNVHTNILDTSQVRLREFLKYQIGLMKGRNLTDIAMARLDPEEFGGMEYRLENDEYDNYQNDFLTGTRSWSVSTGFKLPDPIGIDISRVSLRKSIDYRSLPDTTRFDSTEVWPEVGLGVRASFLNKLPIVKNNINNVSVSSDYTYKTAVERHYSERVNVDSSMVITHELRPLVGFNGTLKKWPISISYNRDYSTTETVANQGARKSVETSNRASLNWTLKPNFRKDEVKFLGFDIPLTGNLRLDLDFTHRLSRELEASRGRNGDVLMDNGRPSYDDENEIKTVNWSLDPRASYDFSTNVTGNAAYSLSNSSSTADGSDQTTHIFTLSVRISF